MRMLNVSNELNSNVSWHRT